jgi:Fe-S cluster assembly protein SufD
MTLAALPTTRDEDWRYADPAELARLEPAVLDGWKDVALSAGEVRCKELLLGEGQSGIHRVRLTVGEGARAELFAVLSAPAYTRLEVEVTLAEGAHFELGGVTIGGGDVVREIVTRVTHAAPNATSNQVVRSVHWDTATGNFLGRLMVARDAQKTDAAQSFKALLLTRGASANAKPELEIFADDVKCAHGAAIGQIDQAAAFYMAARGLPPELARKLLVQAFVADAFVAHREPEALLEAALGALGDAA